ncbi:phosphatase PAP2 family protein [Paenibacillus tarimensis]
MKRTSEQTVYLMIIIASFTLFIYIISVLPEKGALPMEKSVSEWMAETVSEPVTAFWKKTSWMGSSLFIIGATLLLSGLMSVRTGWRTAIMIPIAVAVSYGMNTWIKSWINRPRPAAAWGIEAEGASFPSANAMLACTLYGLIALLYWRYSTKGKLAKTIVAACAVMLIVIIGWSRLYFSVHYALDIVAGYDAALAVISGFMLLQSRRAAKEAHSDLGRE